MHKIGTLHFVLHKNLVKIDSFSQTKFDYMLVLLTLHQEELQTALKKVYIKNLIRNVFQY